MSAGVKLQDVQRFRRNRFYKSAMHAAVQYPDLAQLMWRGGIEVADDNLSSLPGSRQVVVPSNTCEKDHYGCRRSCCRLLSADCRDCRQQSIPAQAVHSRSHVSSHRSRKR